MIYKIDLLDVRPEFNKDNWKIVGTYKVEYVNGSLYTNVPNGHWIKSKIGLIHTISGDYMNDDNNEISRIIGDWCNEYVIYVFQKKP